MTKRGRRAGTQYRMVCLALAMAMERDRADDAQAALEGLTTALWIAGGWCSRDVAATPDAPPT